MAWLLVTTVLWVSFDRLWETMADCAIVFRVLRLESCTTRAQEATVQDERRYRGVDSRSRWRLWGGRNLVSARSRWDGHASGLRRVDGGNGYKARSRRNALFD